MMWKIPQLDNARRWMPYGFVAGSIGFFLVVVLAVVMVRNLRSRLACIVLAILLLLPAAFCVFGFLATFEPINAAQQWTFRIFYGMNGTGLAVVIMFLLVKPINA